MRLRKTRILIYALVALCALVYLPFQAMLLLRDGWILANKEGYQPHSATVTNAKSKRGSGHRSRRVVEATLKAEESPSFDESKLVLSPHDFESFPKEGDTVKVWINRTTAELAVQGEPVARVGDWHFQRVTMGRVAQHVLVLVIAVGVFVMALRGIKRTLDGRNS